VYLVRDGELTAAFTMADVIREESYPVVDALHELGIDTVFAEVLPDDKDEKVQELQD